MGIYGWPVGEPLTRRVLFADKPEVGDITESFSGKQWRIIAVEQWRDRWEVTEVKLDPDDYEDEAQWVMKTPHDP